jgi:hypothetical protein
MFRVDAALGEAAGDEPKAWLRRAREHVAQFLAFAESPDRAEPSRDVPIAAANAFYEWTITADDSEGRVARALRICVGNEVRKLYGDVPNEPIPAKIADLLHRLDQ